MAPLKRSNFLFALRCHAVLERQGLSQSLVHIDTSQTAIKPHEGTRVLCLFAAKLVHY